MDVLYPDDLALPPAVRAEAYGPVVEVVIPVLPAQRDERMDALENRFAAFSMADVDGLEPALLAKFDKAGGPVTGPIELPGAPTNALHAATKAYVDQIVAAQDAMVFKGVIDASANPNYPAADRGWTWRISVAGRIGGGAGVPVEAGDLIICLLDGTAAGTHAAVGSRWTIVQANLDGAVIGPASATDGAVAVFDGISGKLLKEITFAALKIALALVKSDVGLGNVDNTSDAAKWAAAATLTNKGFDTAGAGNSLKINGVAVTDSTGTGAVARETSPVFQTSASFNLGATANFQLARVSDATTFNLLSFNNVLTSAGALGIYAGGDLSVYYNALTGGAHQFRIAGVTAGVISSTALYPNTDKGLTLGTSTRSWGNTYVDKLFINGNQVVGARDTGWTAMTGAGSKGALAAAAAGTASGAYVQAELQGALNRVAALEARLRSLDAALIAHGLIGT